MDALFRDRNEVAAMDSREKLRTKEMGEFARRLLTEPGLNTSQVESDKKLVADFLKSAGASMHLRKQI